MELFIPGSATAVRYRGAELMLVTQDQLMDVDQSQVAMLKDSGPHCHNERTSRYAFQAKARVF